LTTLDLASDEIIFMSQSQPITLPTLDNQPHLSGKVNCPKHGWKLFQIFHRTHDGRERKP